MFISEDEDIIIAKVAPSRPEGDIAESFDALCIIVSRVYTEPFGETRKLAVWVEDPCTETLEYCCRSNPLPVMDE